MASCIVCGVRSDKKRTLHPAAPSNEKARHFFLNVLVPGQIFQQSQVYACRQCFAKLEKGSRQYSSTVSLIKELRASLCSTGGHPVAMDEPNLLPSDMSTCFQSAQKRSSENAESGTPKRPRIDLPSPSSVLKVGLKNCKLL